jgi:hypothetical protein
MWNTADVIHFKVQSRTLSKRAKDPETSVRTPSDCVEIWTEERINLKQDCRALEREAW